MDRWASEILEDAPDTVAIIAGRSGWRGLITGVRQCREALRPEIRIWGAEPETAAPAALSVRQRLGAGVFRTGRPTFVDGAGGKSVFPRHVAAQCSRWWTATSW